MRLHKLLPVIGLLILGAAFAVGNVWFFAVRSTIPLQLNGQVTHKDRLNEKILGVDDVYLITLDDGPRIQVDGPIYEAVVLNREVRKDAWSRKLEADGKTIDIDWSRDFNGMIWAMPFVLLLFVLLGILTLRKSSLVDTEQ